MIADHVSGLSALGAGATVCCTVVAMEAVAWGTHKYIMHGWGWGWHQSHHCRHEGLMEKNDLYAVVAAAVAILLFLAAPGRGSRLFWIGVGLSVYGALYTILHDGLVHQRWAMRFKPRHPYLRRLIQAHRLHHATQGRLGAVSFGFLYAPPPRRLAEQLRRRPAGPRA